MAGPIQSAISGATSLVAGVAVGAKKLSEDAKQASEKASSEAKAEEEASAKKQADEKAKRDAEVAKKEATVLEAKGSALEADLINMGADPESARAFMNARELGLSTKKFMLRNNGRFSKAYSTIADMASKDALTDSLSSKVLNKQGFADRVVALGGTRQARVKALVEASKGGKK